MTDFFFYVILNAVKNPTEELTAHILFRWDISLALNMTKKKSVIASRRRGNPLEKVWSIYFITLVVGYFACAQYDVLFLLRHPERQ